MILLAIVVAAAIAMLCGLAIGVGFAREERAAFRSAIEEWVQAKREVPPLSRVPASQYLRLRRAEAVLRSLVAEDELEGDART